MKSLILLSLIANTAMAAENLDRLLFDPSPLGANKTAPRSEPAELNATGAKAPEKTVKKIAAPSGMNPGTVTPIETPASPALQQPKPAAEKLPSGPITLYAAGNYRLRKGPWGAVQLIIPKGKAFEIIGRDKDFYLVRYNGKTGYVHQNGLDHPLAEAILAEESLKGLKRFEAAEIAACLAQADKNSAISPDMKDFFQRVHASLENYRDTDPKVEKAPQKSQAPHRVKPAEIAVAPPSIPALAPATAPTAAPTVSGDALKAETVPLPPRRPSTAELKKGQGSLLPKPAPEKEYEPNEEDERSNSVTPDAVKRLSIASDRAAGKCRKYADFICQRRGLCGTSCNPGRSKGMCKAGVREILQEAYGFHLPGGSATASNAALKRSPKFTEIKGTDCAKAPVGAICIYDAAHHHFGHIEVKSGANKYCSDYCAARPVSKRSYKVRAIYVPSYNS